ncbi:MAG: helix-turn-helix domain-containing protein [Pedobacter sp.]|uniref:AraC family transcriptional regulator n=1 Tax=Pedobacter sp. TaxID=1411316 RepID=UPI00339A74BA
MHLIHISPKTKGKLIFNHQESSPAHFSGGKKEDEFLLTINLNGSESQEMVINGVSHQFEPYGLIPLLSGQIFSFEKPELITSWQYSRNFYCLTDSYFEISCLGMLFHGYSGNLFLRLDEDHREKLRVLQQMFIEEFDTVDTTQTDMLQMLVKRLVIIVTRLAKEQYLSGKVYEEEKFDLIRQFNLLVDQNYSKEHQVQYYASKLNKTPKTLTRIFTQYGYSPPSAMIQERIIMEAKRLFYYTSLSAKEIAYELGFTDAGHFSRFFKNATQQNPSDLRKLQN